MLKLLYVAEPSKAPVLIAVTVLSSTSIEVEWEPVSRELIHGIITKYVILYTDENDTREKGVPASARRAVVNGLRHSTVYSFQILAATVKGNGPPSAPKSAVTKGEVIKDKECSKNPRVRT